jgi:repressor LexA
MAMPKVLQGRPVWAEALRRRREELGLTQEELAARTANELGEELLAQRTISALELGQLYPLKLTTERLSAYLKALRWTPEEFYQATGLEVPLVYRPSGEPREDVVWLPVVATGTAGRPWPQEGILPVPREFVRPGSILVRVDGDSMDTGDDRGIKDGDYVLVDPNLTDLRDGHVYLVEIAGDGLAVKRAKKAGKGWVFISDNPAGPVLTPSEARVVGQVYRKISIQEVK